MISKFVFHFNDTTKWLYIEDAYLSAQFAKKFEKVLEIGVYKGGWLLSVKENNLHLKTIGIDPYPNMKEVRKQFLDEIHRKNYSDEMELYNNWAEFNNFNSNNELFELIHIDGEHSESGVHKDLEESLRIWNNAGIIVADDIFSRPHPGVTSATFKFLSEKKLAPFLLTNKKLYICNNNFYDYYYNEAKHILSSIGIEYQENLNLTNEIYYQSNSIFGKNILIKSGGDKRLEQWRISKILDVKYPLKLKMKDLAYLILPPIIVSLIKRLKTVLIEF
jgi:hypothetical protein